MFAAQPPYSVRRVGTRKETLTRCSWSASRVSAKRPWYCMILSKASDPQIRVVWVICSRVEDGDVVAGWFQVVHAEVELDRLFGAGRHAVGHWGAGAKVVARRKHAAHQRLVVGVRQGQLEARPGLGRAAAVTQFGRERIRAAAERGQFARFDGEVV